MTNLKRDNDNYNYWVLFAIFYAQPHGYNMCLCVDANRDSDGDGKTL